METDALLEESAAAESVFSAALKVVTEESLPAELFAGDRGSSEGIVRVVAGVVMAVVFIICVVVVVEVNDGFRSQGDLTYLMLSTAISGSV